MQDVSALVARQYEAFPYPPPSFDLSASIAAGGYQVGDPSLWRAMLWPEGGAREARSILIAGCGTTQAAWFAYTLAQLIAHADASVSEAEARALFERLWKQGHLLLTQG